MSKFSALIIGLFLATGCFYIKPDYIFEANQTDPVLIFTSDYNYFTKFHVNIDPSSNYSCKKFRLAGYILHDDSIFLTDPPNKEFQIRVPADQVLAIKAFYSYSTQTYYSQCGPIYKSFIPQKGKTYRIHMNEIGSYCSVTISNVTDPASRVVEMPLKDCN